MHHKGEKGQQHINATIKVIAEQLLRLDTFSSSCTESVAMKEFNKTRHFSSDHEDSRLKGR